jgi:hypothetical protein
MAQENGLAPALLGDNQAIITPQDNVGIYASGGSVAGGGFGRVYLGNGLTLLGGLDYQQASYSDVKLNGAGFGALALRYVAPADWTAWSGVPGLVPFAEIGGWGTPNASLTFTRPYPNGAGSAQGQATTGGSSLAYVFGRVGTAWNPFPEDEVAPALEIGNQWLNTGSYAEAMSPGNPFNALGNGANDRMLVGKARAQLTHAFTPDIDATVWAAGAYALSDSNSLVLSVPGVGTFAPTGLGHPAWAEYGARVSYNFTTNVAVDAFADGVSGGKGIGTSAHGGLDLRVSF